MSVRRSPWWFCTGWWSPWCLLDAVARCKVPWICKRHDDAQVRWFEDKYGADTPEPPTSSTITINPAWTNASSATYTWTPTSRGRE